MSFPTSQFFRISCSEQTSKSGFQSLLAVEKLMSMYYWQFAHGGAFEVKYVILKTN
jgi:hypothetical protein